MTTKAEIIAQLEAEIRSLQTLMASQERLGRLADAAKTEAKINTTQATLNDIIGG
jgi:hypothetical protein